MARTRGRNRKRRDAEAINGAERDGTAAFAARLKHAASGDAAQEKGRYAQELA